MEEILDLKGRLQEQRPASWENLPDISLYMDQVLSLMSRQTIHFGEEDHLTAAMVNNYIKDGVAPRAEGKRYNKTHLAYLTMICVLKQVLPVKEESYADLLGLTAKQEDIFKSFRERDDSAIPGDIDFEPSTESVMSYMMNAYLNNAFYYAMLDSAAGEQGARRNAMKSATDNANEMVSTLERIYNTVRQGAITTEITEIVGGAAALED